MSKGEIISRVLEENVGGPRLSPYQEMEKRFFGRTKGLLYESDLENGVNGWKIDASGKIQKIRAGIGEKAVQILYRDIMLIDDPVQGVVEGFQKFIQNPNTSVPLNGDECIEIFSTLGAYGSNLALLHVWEKISTDEFQALFDTLLESYLQKILTRIHTPTKIIDRGIATGITIDTGETHLWGEHDLPEFHIEILKWGLVKGKIQDADIPAGDRFEDLREDMKKEQKLAPLTGLWWEVSTLG